MFKHNASCRNRIQRPEKVTENDKNFFSVCPLIKQIIYLIHIFLVFIGFLGKKKFEQKTENANLNANGSCQLSRSLLTHKICRNGTKIITAFPRCFMNLGVPRCFVHCPLKPRNRKPIFNWISLSLAVKTFRARFQIFRESTEQKRAHHWRAKMLYQNRFFLFTFMTD